MNTERWVEIAGRNLRLSNLDKVLYPSVGFTKAALIDYYVRVSAVLLPHLQGRALTLKRYPDGVEGAYFYEKRCPSHRPDWVRTVTVAGRKGQAPIAYCVVDDLASLAWAANLADLELHTGLALAAAPETPTTLVFDLDPGAPADLLSCAEVAWWLREALRRCGVASFAKTSGGKGLQVYVPINRRESTFDETKAFAHDVALALAAGAPERIVSRMGKAERVGRVFVDWSQNDFHKTTVCVYSLRAQSTPMVSTPLRWREVRGALDERASERLRFEADEVIRRVGRNRDLFAPVLSLQQALPAMSVLTTALGRTRPAIYPV